MTLPLTVRDAEGEEFGGPYMVYVPGWTEERYFAEAPESKFVEFVDGDLIVHSPVSIRHQRVTAFLSFLLQGYVELNNLGKVLQGPAVVRLRPYMNYEPDIFFISEDQYPGLVEQYFSGAPRLIVEVLSRGTSNHDLRVKAVNYRQHGVEEYWAIDPASGILLRHLLPPEAGEPYTVSEFRSGRLESKAVHGFWIEVSWLWAEPLPGALQCLRAISPL